MKMVKNLSKANIRNYEGFVRREELDFNDDGNYFRGFSYKGMPITTLRSNDCTYLTIRVDYLDNVFTYREWMETEEYKLCDMFNGVGQFDLDELIENLEKVIAKVDEMNAKAMTETIDIEEIENALDKEIKYAEAVIKNFKTNFKWYEATEYTLKSLLGYMKSEEREIELAKRLKNKLYDLHKKELKELVQNLHSYRYVRIRRNGFYLTEMLKAVN